MSARLGRRAGFRKSRRRRGMPTSPQQEDDIGSGGCTAAANGSGRHQPRAPCSISSAAADRWLTGLPAGLRNVVTWHVIAVCANTLTVVAYFYFARVKGRGRALQGSSSSATLSGFHRASFRRAMVYDRQHVRRRPRTGDLLPSPYAGLARSKGQDHTGVSCSQVCRDANAALITLV
jgi:hypothetical protein